MYDISQVRACMKDCKSEMFLIFYMFNLLEDLSSLTCVTVKQMPPGGWTGVLALTNSGHRSSFGAGDGLMMRQ